MTNGEFASDGREVHPGRRMSRSSTITERTSQMVRRKAHLAVHPGEILFDELQELGITPTALARQLAAPRNRLTQIIQGKRSITGDTALRLAHWFGMDPQFWLNLQSAYEI